jgi:hypothetical protein
MLGAAAPGLLVASSEHLLEPPTAVLAACAVVSVLYASKWGEGAIQISAAFVCFMLAVAFVGAVGAAAIAVLVDGGSFSEALHHPREILPSLGLTVALTLAIAAVYARYGEAPAVGTHCAAASQAGTSNIAC